jgi:hypothetical protein
MLLEPSLRWESLKTCFTIVTPCARIIGHRLIRAIAEESSRGRRNNYNTDDDSLTFWFAIQSGITIFWPVAFQTEG